MELTSIVWVIPHAEFDLGMIPEHLLARGYCVIRCLPGESDKVQATLRVLQADLFPNLRRLCDEYQADHRPTLVVASSEDQEIAAIDFISETGDVVRGSQSLELLAFRLRRLLKHATGLDLMDALQHKDSLTGLISRRGFDAIMSEFLTAATPDACRAVVLLDLDNFKHVNDQYGHLAGDQVLCEFASLLREAAAPGDRFARWGGDEFVWLMSRYDTNTAESDVRKFLRSIEEHEFFAAQLVQGEGISWVAGVSFKRVLHRFNTDAPAELQSRSAMRTMTASAGIYFVQAQSNAEDILHHADQAVYEAKRKGRNQLVVYEQWKASVAAEDRDLNVEHFKNVTYVLIERMTTLVTHIGENLMEEARREANHDALTGLHNRRYFDSKLAREIERAAKHDHPLTIALLDLDHFGNINKTYGFPSGDRALRRFAEIASGVVRSLDWLARYGGEEFCLVMPDTSLDTGIMVAERIRAAVESAVIQSLDQRRVPVTVSVGVVQWSPDVTDPVGLVQQASSVLLQAKNEGRNRVVARR